MLAARARRLPAWYPAAFALAFVLQVVVEAGVSPYAAGRAILGALAIGIALPWTAGLFVDDRDVAGAIGAIGVLALIGGRSPVVAVVAVTAIILIAVQRAVSRGGHRTSRGPWTIVTRVLTAGALVILVAVGVKAVELGRLAPAAHDLVAEWPWRPTAAVGPARDETTLPSIYLILLDGYPRADKLMDEFGIDNSSFGDALRARGLVVASLSRSNHTTTRVMLAHMFDYGIDRALTSSDRGVDAWRRAINEGAFFRDVRSLGYRTVAVSPGWEHVAVRQADRFIDTGQPNELEWVLVNATAVGTVLDALAPGAWADSHRSRVLDAFDAVEAAAAHPGRGRQVVFAHVASPHAPQVFREDGRPIALRDSAYPRDDDGEIAVLGRDEYASRVRGQIRFLNDRVTRLLDTIIERDPGSVIVVFSDHGSGVGSGAGEGGAVDVDLRTANLLAVRTPGRTGIIDDRSTLANVLPRILRAYAGIGPPDGPETIRVAAEDPDAGWVYARPD